MVFKNIEDAELKNRIVQNLKKYSDSDMVGIMWKGYVTGAFLYAVKSFSRKDYTEIKPLLTSSGDEEGHVFSWYPKSPEERLEAIEDHKRHLAIIAEREGR